MQSNGPQAKFFDVSFVLSRPHYRLYSLSVVSQEWSPRLATSRRMRIEDDESPYIEVTSYNERSLD